MLQDQIARIRPGPVLFHDMARDPDRGGWDEAYQYAYAVEEATAPTSAAISLCCHPDWALPGTAPDSKTQRLHKQLTLAGRIPEVFEGSGNTPSWLASGQPMLEFATQACRARSSGASGVPALDVSFAIFARNGAERNVLK